MFHLTGFAPILYLANIISKFAEVAKWCVGLIYLASAHLPLTSQASVTLASRTA